jgi:hypothetical protein
MPKIVTFARRILLASSAFASLALLATPIEWALADKPSTPVTVTNPAASPALTSSVDDPGRIAYQSVQTPPNCAGANGCAFAFAAVPTGHRLVIQHVSGELILTGTPIAVHVTLLSSISSPRSSFFVPFVGLTNLSDSYFDQPVLHYFGEGDVPGGEIDLIGNSTANTFSDVIVTLTGYLLDCTEIPCAPIAH